ncbi:MAG TPA: hypothetical protein VM118_07295 [Acidobacteriota bacterium]|nr:hypothetical protein [Acidobacteriota bacterium]
MRNTVDGGLATLVLSMAVLLAGCCSEEGGPETECLTIDTGPVTTIIRDYQYDRFRFFDLGLMGDTNVLAPGDTITKFLLYGSTDGDGVGYRYARAHINWLDRKGVPLIEGQFYRAYPDDLLHWELFHGKHYLFSRYRWSPTYSPALAYCMVYRHANGEIDTVGSFATYTGDTIDLQLLRLPDPSPSAPLWNTEWKNVYDLGMRGINYDKLDLRIYKGPEGDEENPANLDHQSYRPYLQLLGLDQTDTAGNGSPDGKIDNNEAILDREFGLVIFPDRFPFADSSLHEPVPGIYSAETDEERRAASKYYLKVTTERRSRQFLLGRVNITEGSEVVTLDGVQLTRGVDYDIDYDLGWVNFNRDDVLDPDVSLVICYEYGRCCPE